MSTLVNTENVLMHVALQLRMEGRSIRHTLTREELVRYVANAKADLEYVEHAVDVQKFDLMTPEGNG